MHFIECILNSYQRMFNNKIQKLRQARNILLYCASLTMKSHILNYYLLFKDNNRYRFFLYYGTADTEINTRIEITKDICNGTTITPVTSKGKLVLTHWDLIVTADLDYEPLRYSKETVPILYVNHGSHIVSVDEEGSLYAYGKRALKDGKCKFTAICEPNVRIYNELNKSNAFKDCVVHVGAKDADMLISEVNNYNVYRKMLGINDNVTLVSVFGTWRKESLFQYLGKGFLEELSKINRDKYMFILSVHPREYVKYDDEIEPMGPIINEYAEKYNFIVRNPSDSYIPYLIASDIVICDYSSLYENALLAKKKLLFSYFPEYSVGKLSIAHELKNEIRVISVEDIPKIYDILEQLRKEDLSEAINKYGSEIYLGKDIYKERITSLTEKLTGLGGFN